MEDLPYISFMVFNGMVFVPPKGINLWLLRAKLIGLIDGLSKNSVYHDDQLDETKS